MLPTYQQLLDQDQKSCDDSYLAHVGWDYTVNANTQKLFSKDNLDSISREITKALEGVDPQGRSIRVPHERICEVLSSVFRFATRPNIGDIHSRFIIANSQKRCDTRDIIDQTINIIVRSITDETETIENNKKLTIWSTLYGDFNEQGLRAHAPIKIRRKHPQYMAFNMNY